MRLTILGFTALAIISFSSCQKDKGEMTDSQLIEAIQKASDKQNIDVAELPSASVTTLTDEYGDENVDIAKLAPKLGYEVDFKTETGSKESVRKQAYFNLQGRLLKGDDDYKDDKNKDKCFEFVYSLTFNMPDGTSTTINNEDEMIRAKKAWAEAGIRPIIQYPLDVKFKGKIITINNEREMKKIKDACDNYKIKCFEMIYPVTYIMLDGTEIIVRSNDEEGWADVKAWYVAHPDAAKRPTVKYPVDIKYKKDGTIVTINNNEEMKLAYEGCKD